MKKIISYSILIIIFIGILYGIKILVWPESESVLYGNRLDGIKDIDISGIDPIIEKLNAEEAISEATYRIQGKIINIEIKAEDFADKAYIKNVVTNEVKTLSEEVLTYYDVQVFIEKTVEDATEYSIGYKNKASESIVWTN